MAETLTWNRFKEDPALGTRIGVPGELAGLVAAHRKFGKKKWSELVRPSTELCDGFQMFGYMRECLEKLGNKLFGNERMCEDFVRDGEIIRLAKL